MKVVYLGPVAPRERVARDAERERLILEWDLGYEEPETA